jgi:hypothetical protein
MLAFTVVATSLFASAKSPDQHDSWSVLGQITHKRSYEIETRDRKCVWGTITRVAVDGLAVKVYTPNSSGSAHTVMFHMFPRADVLRVRSGPIYYSGRSSWADVSSVQVKARERLKIVTSAGKTYPVKQPYTVSDDGITLDLSGKSTKLSKREIAQVYYLVPKPLTDFGDYSMDELGPMIIFDPDWYIWGLHLERHVSVLLYTAGDPEDNSSSQCMPR